jgi:hypothetical protein
VAGIAIAPTAAVAATDGDCGGSEICLYYGYRLQGPLYDTGGDVTNYSGKTFVGSSFALNDNVASARSRAIWQECLIYENANYGGTYYMVESGSTVNNLGIMANEGSSHSWF